MKKSLQKVQDVLQKPLGMVVACILLFYMMTFLVYSIYSPGPEERKQTQTDMSPHNP